MRSQGIARCKHQHNVYKMMDSSFRFNKPVAIVGVNPNTISLFIKCKCQTLLLFSLFLIHSSDTYTLTVTYRIHIPIVYSSVWIGSHFHCVTYGLGCRCVTFILYTILELEWLDNIYWRLPYVEHIQVHFCFWPVKHKEPNSHSYIMHGPCGSIHSNSNQSPLTT